MTWVPASAITLPSDLPPTMRASPSSSNAAIELSRPSACQPTRLRSSWTKPRRSLGVFISLELVARPAPMPPCRQNAVGPWATTTSRMAPRVATTAIARRTPDRCERAEATTVHTLKAASSQVARYQTPGAVSQGRSPKPPASEPAMAPAVFHA